jgi:hypothetical protein
MVRRSLLVAGFAAGFAVSASAATVQFHATLNGASEVPPTNSKGTGETQATLNTETHQLTYDTSWQGLSTPATMAHFHGPAPAGKNAAIEVWQSKKGESPTSPLKGTVTLTAQQQQQLMSGMWYTNVHDSAHPAGAIRGQMVEAK